MLTAHSYRTRGANFAFLVGPPQDLTRRDGMNIHASVCDALGVEDLSFRYTPGEEDAKGFVIQLGREQGREKFVLEINGAVGDTPLRVFFGYEWPRSAQAAFEDFDLVSEAVFEVLGEGWQRILAEARVRGQAHAKGDSAVSFLSRDVLGLPDEGMAFAALKYETEAADATPGDPLANPKRDVSLEVLREDTRCVYVEVMSQWPQIATPAGQAVQINPEKVRTFDSPPSEYLRDTVKYTESAVFPLLDRNRTEDET